MADAYLSFFPSPLNIFHDGNFVVADWPSLNFRVAPCFAYGLITCKKGTIQAFSTNNFTSVQWQKGCTKSKKESSWRIPSGYINIRLLNCADRHFGQIILISAPLSICPDLAVGKVVQLIAQKNRHEQCHRRKNSARGTEPSGYNCSFSHTWIHPDTIALALMQCRAKETGRE